MWLAASYHLKPAPSQRLFRPPGCGQTLSSPNSERSLAKYPSVFRPSFRERVVGHDRRARRFRYKHVSDRPAVGPYHTMLEIPMKEEQCSARILSSGADNVWPHPSRRPQARKRNPESRPNPEAAIPLRDRAGRSPGWGQTPFCSPPLIQSSREAVALASGFRVFRGFPWRAGVLNAESRRNAEVPRDASRHAAGRADHANQSSYPSARETNLRSKTSGCLRVPGNLRVSSSAAPRLRAQEEKREARPNAKAPFLQQGDSVFLGRGPHHARSDGVRLCVPAAFAFPLSRTMPAHSFRFQRRDAESQRHRATPPHAPRTPRTPREKHPLPLWGIPPQRRGHFAAPMPPLAAGDVRL